MWKPNTKVIQVCMVAVLVPTIAAFLILAIVQQLGYGESKWFVFNPNWVAISGGPFVLGIGKQNWLTFILNILLTGIVYSTISGESQLEKNLGGEVSSNKRLRKDLDI